MPDSDAIQNYKALFNSSDPSFGAVLRYTPHLYHAGQQYLKGKLLDIGAGGKNKEILLGEFVDDYLGLDHPITLHEKSRLDLFGTAYDIPLQDCSVDSILCTEVLEHLEEPSDAIGEAFRVLKSDGYAIYTMPFFWHIHEEPRDFFRYTEFGLQYLFEKNGFEIVEIRPLSGFWVTFLTEFNYYLHGYKHGLKRLRLMWLLNAFVWLNNRLMLMLDRGKLRQDRFTWLYLVIVRKP